MLCWQRWMPKEGGLDKLKWLGVNPGAEYGPAKRWPAEKFGEAVAEFLGARRAGVFLFGGPGDVETAASVERVLRRQGHGGYGGPVLNLAGRTDLRSLILLMASCRVVLTNDSGPMHVAAAAGARVVALFGSTSPELTGPGLPGDSRHVCLREPTPCSPCFLRTCPVDFRCLGRLEVGRVVKAMLHQWDEAG